MRELPICMTAESVLAIIHAKKSQTRRLIKPNPVLRDAGREGSWMWSWTNGKSRKASWSSTVRNPVSILEHLRYREGDRLWVREVWASSAPGLVAYRSTLEAYKVESVGRELIGLLHCDYPQCDPPGLHYVDLADFGGRWRNPWFMPRWASRFQLQVQWVRVERLQDITEQDAEAEGVTKMFLADAASFIHGKAIPDSSYRTGYRIAWDRMHGKDNPWESNPWVSVTGFHAA